MVKTILVVSQSIIPEEIIMKVSIHETKLQLGKYARRTKSRSPVPLFVHVHSVGRGITMERFLSIFLQEIKLAPDVRGHISPGMFQQDVQMESSSRLNERVTKMKGNKGKTMV